MSPSDTRESSLYPHHDGNVAECHRQAEKTMPRKDRLSEVAQDAFAPIAEYRYERAFAIATASWSAWWGNRCAVEGSRWSCAINLPQHARFCDALRIWEVETAARRGCWRIEARSIEERQRVEMKSTVRFERADEKEGKSILKELRASRRGEVKDEEVREWVRLESRLGSGEGHGEESRAGALFLGAGFAHHTPPNAPATPCSILIPSPDLSRGRRA